MIKCTWCNKEWEWDWDQDEIVGAESLEFGLVPPIPVPLIRLHLYLCTCGGSLGVLTEEPKGSTLLVGVGEEDCYQPEVGPEGQ